MDADAPIDTSSGSKASLRTVAGTLIALVAVGATFAVIGSDSYSDLHTLLDAATFVLSGLLALLLWDVGTHAGRALPRWLAIGFACTSLLELIHALVGVDWSGQLAPIREASAVLRPTTWPPPAYLLPIAVGASLVLASRRRALTLAFTALLLLLGAGFLAFFYWLPHYAPPNWLGVSRPTLFWVPLLWTAVAALAWRARASDRLAPALAWMAGVLVVANAMIVYSRTPHDVPAILAHLGKLGAYLVVLLLLMRMASSDMVARTRAERALEQLNKELEGRVEQRTAQLGAVLDTALDGVVVMDETGRIAEFNSAAERIFGHSRSAVLGRPMHDVIIPPALREAHQRGLARYLRTGENRVLGRRIEINGLRADGSEIPVELSINRMPGPGPVLFAGFVRDITERKSAADALRESQERYQTLAESLPHLVWTCRPDGWCDYLSRQWVEYTGRPEAEQLGYGWAEHLHPEDRERTRAAWAEATARGDQFDIEFRIRRFDGVYRWFKTRALPLRDGAGTIVKWFGSNTDIEDYKQAEERGRAQLARLSLLDQTTRAIGERQDLRSIFQVAVRSLEERMPIDFACVCLHDPADGSLIVSCVGVKSLPLAEELAMPEQARIVVDQNGLSQCLRGRLVYEPDIGAVPFAFAQRLVRGGLRSLVVAPLLVESHVFGVLVAARRETRSFSSADCEFLRQLSEHIALAAHQARLYTALQRAYDDLRQTQQAVMQQERLRALGQMASGIAHDINNALSPVALYAESLLENEPHLSVRAREYLQTIQHSTDDIAATVARMREFYREREPQLQLLPVSLNALVQQVVNLTRARWSDIPQQRGVVIDLSTELPIGLPDVRAVDSEIREAITNLIFNAVDAMPEGGTLTLRTSLSVGGEVQLEVIDTGIGMDEDIRRRCLEPFFTTKGERGTGLGLAMVYGTVQRHGAELEIESTPSRGTTMRIVFAANSGRVESAPAPQEPRRLPSVHLRILVIDDDPLLLKSLREILEADGHMVVAANGGREGIEAFHSALERGEPFSVVITDLGMPHVDGRRVAERVKASAPGVPVILLTGWGQRLVAEGDIPAHVDQVLSKPPKLRELRSALAIAFPS